MAGISELERQSQENEIKQQEVASGKKIERTPEQLLDLFVRLCRTVRWKAKKYCDGCPAGCYECRPNYKNGIE